MRKNWLFAVVADVAAKTDVAMMDVAISNLPNNRSVAVVDHARTCLYPDALARDL